jgi:hypothetical protein
VPASAPKAPKLAKPQDNDTGALATGEAAE